MSGNLAQCQIVEQFADRALNIRSLEVVVPDLAGIAIQVGGEDGITVAGILEPGELSGLLWIDRKRSSYGDETMLPLPALRFVAKLGDAPPELEVPEPGLLGQVVVDFVTATDDGIRAAGLLENVEERSRKEARVGQEANARAGDVRGNLFQATLDKETSSGIRSSIPRSEGAMPKFRAVIFTAQNGMIGASASGFGVVAQARPLVFAPDSEHHRIQMKRERTPGPGKGEEFLAQRIVQSHQLPNSLRPEPLEKATDRSLLGQAGHA